MAGKENRFLEYTYYYLTVTLLDLEPPVWRRFLIQTGATFMDLHKAIQVAGPWQDYHLFEFRAAPAFRTRLLAGIPDQEDGADMEIPDARLVKLNTFFDAGPGTRCVYTYDFGDCWQHDVKSNGVTSLPYKFKRCLLDGARAFPPEDAGGTPGYEDCVAALAMPKAGVPTDPDAEDRRRWLGGWRPDAFDFYSAKRKFDK